MIRTDNYIRSLSSKGLIDDALFLDNGYDIQYKGNIVSVRLNDRGGAVIFNQKKNNLFEVCSGRLDEVLHKYIFQSLFGLQDKIGIKDIECRNTAFVPTKVIKQSVVFEDSCGRKFTMTGNSPKAVLSFYKEACEVNADDCMILLSNFVPYDRNAEYVASNVETPEIELQILKSSVNAEDYAVTPDTKLINNVGRTIVGNFLCSASDKWNLMTFEEDQKKMLTFNSLGRKSVTSSTVRSKDPMVNEAKKLLSSSRQAVGKYVDEKYPRGLCVSAMENVLAWEAPEICKAAKIENIPDYKFIFESMIKNANRVQFRLDSSKSILCSVEKDGISAAKFRAVPVLSEMKEPLLSNGYLLTELESGIELDAGDTAIGAIVSSCREFVPVAEKALNTPNSIEKVIGSDCKTALMSYGINDTKNVFSSFYRIVIN